MIMIFTDGFYLIISYIIHTNSYQYLEDQTEDMHKAYFHTSFFIVCYL